MADYTDPRWNESDSQNTAPSPNGIPAGSAPSAVPAVIRNGMGAQTRSFNRGNARGLCANTGNAYSLTYDVPPTAYENGEFFSFFVSAANTGPATITINGMPTKDLAQNDGTPLKASDLLLGAPVTVTYDGSKFRLVTAAGKPYTTTTVGAGSGLDSDKLDGQEGGWYQARANHTGTQDVATISGLQAVLDAIVPASTIIHVAAATAPAGYLAANGQNVSRTTYARLFTAIGTTYGVGDGSTTFALPDMRGVFVRGLDSGKGTDTGRVLGSFQDSANLAHNHGVTDPGHGHSGYTDVQGHHAHTMYFRFTSKSGNDTPWVASHPSAGEAQNGAGNLGTDGAGSHSHNVGVYAATTGISILNNGGTESRPKNIALLACIKF